MNVQPITDLTPFTGARVVIDHTRTARVTTIKHGAESRLPELRDGVGGLCIEDPHPGCQGGSTAFWWPYGTDLELETR